MLVYQIKLTKKKNVDEFVKFMQEEYIPGVHKGATRVGQVTELMLLQGEKKNEFLWHIGWSGLSERHPNLSEEELQKFSATMKLIGTYRKAAVWPEDNLL